MGTGELPYGDMGAYELQNNGPDSDSDGLPDACDNCVDSADCNSNGASDCAERSPGLLGTYYPAIDFTGTPTVRIDQWIDFTWRGDELIPTSALSPILDANGDGVADGCVLGDLDADGDVDLDDYNLFLAAYGSAIGDANYDENADFDGDGFIGTTDFGIWCAHYLAFANS